jgi:hypothetical protein
MDIIKYQWRVSKTIFWLWGAKKINKNKKMDTEKKKKKKKKKRSPASMP